MTVVPSPNFAYDLHLPAMQIDAAFHEPAKSRAWTLAAMFGLLYWA